MRGSSEVRIDELTYKVTMYSATKGLKLLTRLSKIVGKSLGLVSTNMDKDITGDIIGEAIGSIMEQIDEDLVIRLVKEMLDGVSVDKGDGYKPIQFDIDFAGRYGHLFKVLKEVLTFQYSDFFGQLAEAGSMLRREQEVPAKTIKAI